MTKPDCFLSFIGKFCDEVDSSTLNSHLGSRRLRLAPSRRESHSTESPLATRVPEIDSRIGRNRQLRYVCSEAFRVWPTQMS